LIRLKLHLLFLMKLNVMIVLFFLADLAMLMETKRRQDGRGFGA
jgi:hypothetical protein